MDLHSFGPLHRKLREAASASVLTIDQHLPVVVILAEISTPKYAKGHKFAIRDILTA
jgi:hypothetical protein